LSCRSWSGRHRAVAWALGLLVRCRRLDNTGAAAAGLP
jgi:hypothetical protein